MKYVLNMSFKKGLCFGIVPDGMKSSYILDVNANTVVANRNQLHQHYSVEDCKIARVPFEPFEIKYADYKDIFKFIVEKRIELETGRKEKRKEELEQKKDFTKWRKTRTPVTGELRDKTIETIIDYCSNEFTKTAPMYHTKFVEQEIDNLLKELKENKDTVKVNKYIVNDNDIYFVWPSNKISIPIYNGIPLLEFTITGNSNNGFTRFIEFTHKGSTQIDDAIMFAQIAYNQKRENNLLYANDKTLSRHNFNLHTAQHLRNKTIKLMQKQFVPYYFLKDI